MNDWNIFLVMFNCANFIMLAAFVSKKIVWLRSLTILANMVVLPYLFSTAVLLSPPATQSRTTLPSELEVQGVPYIPQPSPFGSGSNSITIIGIVQQMRRTQRSTRFE